MRKLLIGIAMVVSVTATSALAQAVSGGQSPQANGDVQTSNSYNSNNPMDQYREQRQLNNIPGQQTSKAADSKSDRARPATAAELIAGAPVRDKTGVAMAKIEQIDPDGVVVSTGTLKVKVPAKAFGHNRGGLLLDMTKAEFDQIVAKANAAS